MLESGDALGHNFRHFGLHRVVPIGDAHVIRIVSDGLFRAHNPCRPGVHQFLSVTGNTKIHHHRRAACQSRLGAALVIIRRAGAHKRHVKMGMRVNAAGHDITALGVNDVFALQALSDRSNDLAFNQNIGLVGAIRCYNRAVFNDSRHEKPPSFMKRLQLFRALHASAHWYPLLPTQSKYLPLHCDLYHPHRA